MKERESRKLPCSSRKRRGISTVVGTLLFLVLMFGTFGTIITTMELQSDLIETTRDVAGQELSRIKENFDLRASADSSNRLSAYISNLGSETIEIVDLWVVDTDTSPYTATRYSVDTDDAFVPAGSNVDIVGSQTITLAAGTYDIKAVSSLGTIESVSLEVTASGSASDLVVKLITVPPQVGSGENATLVMHVYNRGAVAIDDVAPADPTVTPSSAVSSFALTSPSSVSSLDPDESAVFTWHYTLTGAVGSQVSFSASASGTNSATGATITSNTDSEDIEFVQSFVTDRIADTLAAKIEIYTGFPSPFGDAGGNQYGYFAVTLINPTSTSITVNQVSLALISGDEQGNEDMIDGFQGVSPSTGWSENGLSAWWTNTASPITINAYSAEDWVVKIDSENNEDSPINTLAINAYTSYGQFGKTVNTFASSEEDVAIPNIYQSSTSAGNDQIYAITGVSAGTSRNYYVTIYNSNTGSASSGEEQINVGSMVIINVPPGFTNISVTPPSGMSVSSSSTLDDGSTHIKVRVDSAIGVNSKKTITLTATAPDVDASLHLFYLFVTGTTTDKDGDTVVIGSVAETVVQVT